MKLISRLFLLGYCATLLWPVGSAFALSFGGVALSSVMNEDDPGVQAYITVAAPETSVRKYVEVRNTGNESLTAFVFASGYSFEHGEIIYVEQSEAEKRQRSEPGHWITFDTNKVDLPPEGRAKIGFVIDVPEDADVGDHEGVILATGYKGEAKTKGTGFQIVTQIGSVFRIVVPGEVKRELVINKISHRINPDNNRTMTFDFNVTNLGNVRIAPVLDTKLRGIFGAIGEQEGRELTSVTRNETLTISSQWIQRAPYVGRFVADFVFHMGEHEQANEDGSTTLLPDEVVKARYVFWIFPWVETLVLLAVIVILYALRSFWLYLVVIRRLKTRTKSYTAVSGDTLTKIAAKFGADPRVLAQFNMMRWPYEINPGDRLLIPTGYLEKDEWRDTAKTVLADRQILGGILAHLFRRRDPRVAVDRLTRTPEAIQSPVERVAVATEPVVVESGDTIADVADFAGVSVAEIAQLNGLKPPYRLRGGQELLVPQAPPAPKRRSTKSKSSIKKPGQTPGKKTTRKRKR